MDYSLAYMMTLVMTGFVAGIINILAGGGSHLTLPALMLTGMPADVANATNRVGVFLHCLVGIGGYNKYDKIHSDDIVPALIPTLIGGVIGAILASVLPATLLKPLLLATMLGVALLILIFPSMIEPPEGTLTYTVNERPLAWLMLFITGIYGGFVQAGVGFLLITVLAGTLRYDLVRTNALKLICTCGFTALALIIFVIDGLVSWIPGLILAVGSMIGAAVAVKISLNISQRIMKWFVFLMTLAASATVMLFH
ncbi:permease [Candidatus Endobugula sertula]|uniref:Probable membrane transporter protein n=1 Tax=Candidatus Endobugula sertula TaxID=62101 RepID=A0A1D2QTT6_9GAMM|nr:permease [Candidatus Endobugula sertula]